jgi:hypothetical protein
VYRSSVISSVLSRISATVLLLGGAGLLFAADEVLPVLVPGFPPGGAWLGQLLGAAWLAVAALNWLQRASVLGGIYGRQVVLPNLTLYFVSALTLFRVALGGARPAMPWMLCALMAVMAAAYGALLLRGPFDSLDRQSS